jgi:hypothetical protein
LVWVKIAFGISRNLARTKTQQGARLALCRGKRYRPERTNPEIGIPLEIHFLGGGGELAFTETGMDIRDFGGGERKGTGISGCASAMPAKSQFGEKSSFSEDQLLLS